MSLTKPDRLALILQSLTDAPAPNSRVEALALMQRVFKEIEDAHSGAPDTPDHPDRMHPAVADMEEDIPNEPSVKRYRHKGHYTLIADNGAIAIRRFIYEIKDGKKRRVGEKTDFSKPGADGLDVPNLS
jgi:hypothetical protein